MNGPLELVVGIALAAAAVYFVLRPIISPLPQGAGEGGTDGGDDPEDDFSPRAVALRALKEIEFDRATGKLTDLDYDALKRKYTAEALVALRSEESTPPTVQTRVSLPFPKAACPSHGPRPEPHAAFCSICGRRLADASSFCARCGAALEHDARFCSGCGRRVAA